MFWYRKFIKAAYIKGIEEGFRMGRYSEHALVEGKIVVLGIDKTQMDKDIDEILNKKGGH